MNAKVVFILGAGFSRPALGFAQSEILKYLRKFHFSAKPRIFEFLEDVYGDPIHVPLEDVYTLLDRTIQLNESVKSYDARRLSAMKRDLDESIVGLFDHAADKHNRSYIQRFAEKIADLRWDAYKGQLGQTNEMSFDNDRVAIISTNWDILLERALGEIISEPNTKYRSDIPLRGHKRRMFIDHCMYDFQLDPRLKIDSSLRLKPYGFANLKLLKLHGSFNWFRCPNCSGVFVNYNLEPLKFPQDQRLICHVCRKNQVGSHRLKRYFISPTFLKDLTSSHFRSIWWNAGYELSEASHIVFIGYSLPQADYDFRYLLAKHVRPDTRLTVVLRKKNTAATNFWNFFGARRKKMSVVGDGVQKFVREMAMSDLLSK